ncbi:DNA cytosine methyltransferase [Pseudomonas sp. NA-150]|uniref:DNA cytosine methyltransferase n=1 Tax=Pseudomonas sp. NA-150 TaxID=3367525 RepID=UPI0037CB1102
MNELALFAGAGGGILGGVLLGWRTVCAVERDAYAAQILAQRQNDGLLPSFPIWSDVRSFDGKPWRGLVDVVSGGFPCQDISAAGHGAGIAGARSGLWGEMARIVGEVRPEFVWVENSPLLVGRGLAVVLGDLAEMGYDARWGVVGAADLGAPHQRDRIWIVANTNGPRESQPTWCEQERRLGPVEYRQAMADADSIAGQQGWTDHPTEKPRRRNADRGSGSQNMADTGSQHGEGLVPGSAETQVRRRPVQRPPGSCRHGFGRWPTEPGMGRVAHGVAHRVDRIKALGNGQVPRVAAATFKLLLEQ